MEVAAWKQMLRWHSMYTTLEDGGLSTVWHANDVEFRFGGYSLQDTPALAIRRVEWADGGSRNDTLAYVIIRSKK